MTLGVSGPLKCRIFFSLVNVIPRCSLLNNVNFKEKVFYHKKIPNFLKEIELLNVIGSGNIHRSREIEPHEAAIYSLQAEELETFSGSSVKQS